MITRIIQFFKDVVQYGMARRFLDAVNRQCDNRMSERGMIAQAFEFTRINHVEGDYFEFGLWRGKTFCYAHAMKHRYKLDHLTLLGFDSFQGLPPITERTDNVWHDGEFACAEEEFRSILRRHNFDEGEYLLIPGFYEHSLNDDLHARIQGKKAAVVYIDCDLYESTACVLDWVHRYLQNGSIVCFDDFYTYRGDPNKGEQRALQEFLHTHSEYTFIPYFSYSPVGCSFIVQRCAQSVLSS